MRRREFITLVGSAAAWPLAAGAQEAGRTYQIGGLSAGPRGAPYWVGLFDELRRAGFIEGQNLTIDWHQFGKRVDQIPEFAAELVKAKVDVIVATGDPAIRAVQRATTTIPILGSTEDMVGSGLVNSLARPEGNTTGTSILATELDGKRQEILIAGRPRSGQGLWRSSNKRSVVARPVRQSPDYYSTRGDIAPAGYLSISGRGGGRRSYRLRTECRPRVSRACRSDAHQALTRCQASRSSD
jgi:hypothetical protein